MARRFTIDLLRSGMIQAQGTPNMALKPSKVVMRDNHYHKVASDTSAWELEFLPRPQRREPIAVSFWKSASESYAKFPIESVELYIHSDYDPSYEDWDSSKFEVLLSTDTCDGSVAVYEDVVIRWGDIEHHLSHNAMSMPYKLQGISAFNDFHCEKRSGRPLSEKWKDWAAEVAVSLVCGRVWSDMTALQFTNEIEKAIQERGIEPIGTTIGHQAAQTVLSRLRSK